MDTTHVMLIDINFYLLSFVAYVNQPEKASSFLTDGRAKPPFICPSRMSAIRSDVCVVAVQAAHVRVRTRIQQVPCTRPKMYGIPPTIQCIKIRFKTQTHKTSFYYTETFIMKDNDNDDYYYIAAAV